MRLQDLIGEEPGRALMGATAVLALGSTEYHGPRGPYGTDCDVGWQGRPEEAKPERGERAAEVTAEAVVEWLKGQGIGIGGQQRLLPNGE